MHTDTLPPPGVFGTTQNCLANVPWTNEIFYYAMVALDERGNRGEISNIVTVYIHEVTTTTVTTTTASSSTLDPYLILKYLKNKNLNESIDIDEESFLRNISELEDELERSNGEIYTAVGIVCGVVIMIVILLVSVVLISRKRKRSDREDNSGPASTTTSNTSQVSMISISSKFQICGYIELNSKDLIVIGA